MGCGRCMGEGWFLSPHSCYFYHSDPPHWLASPALEWVLVRQLGCSFYSGWHLPRGFLNLIHSGLHNSQGHVFLCLDVFLTAAVASHNILPSRVMQMLGLGGPRDKCSLVHQEVHLWFVFATTLLRWVSPLPFLFFVWLFSHCLLEFQVQELIRIAAVNNCPLPRWPYSLCSHQSRMQEIWDSVLPSQLSEVPKHENGLVTSKATRLFLAKEGEGYSSGPSKSSVFKFTKNPVLRHWASFSLNCWCYMSCFPSSPQGRECPRVMLKRHPSSSLFQCPAGSNQNWRAVCLHRRWECVLRTGWGPWELRTY